MSKNEDNSMLNNNNNLQKDQEFMKVIEKVTFYIKTKLKPLLGGINLYKKFQNSSSLKLFDVNKAKEFPPEKCGYAMRLVRLNPKDISIEFKKGRMTENKISIQELKSVLISTYIRDAIKRYHKSIANKANSGLESHFYNGYVPMKLILMNGDFDFIAESYQMYVSFQQAIEEIIKNKKNIISLVQFAALELNQNNK